MRRAELASLSSVKADNLTSIRISCRRDLKNLKELFFRLDPTQITHSRDTVQSPILTD